MDSFDPWEIVESGFCVEDATEDDLILYEEALNYIMQDALELCEQDDFYMWKADAEAGAFNLADYYERIGKYELALKYYTISKKFGCDFADERIDGLMI